MNNHNKYIIVVFLIGLFLLCRISFDKLIETPPTWMDEGIIIQTARNFSVHGFSGLRTDPDTLVSAGYVTTSYPVTLPIAGSFYFFGQSLYHARIVMAIFIILLVVTSLLWLRKKDGWGNRFPLLLCFFLLITFPPLYGQGKNVLGEVPGLFFLFASILSLEYRRMIFAGLFLGLAIVTKPIFILLIPALGIAGIIKYKTISKRDVLSLLSFLIPIMIWIPFQFHGETIGEMLAVYSNPHSVITSSSIVVNLSRFVTESQPIYTAILMLCWSIVIFLRVKKQEIISMGEWILWIFTLLVLLAYMRSIGYYRYFFLAEFIALCMFSFSIFHFAKKKSLRVIASCICILLISIQTYSLVYTGWTAQYSQNTQSIELERLMKTFPVHEEILIYQAPELVTFITHENYSQFIDITKTIRVGSTSLQRIEQRIPTIVGTNSQYVDYIQKMSKDGYVSFITIGKYQFLRKRI